MTCWRTARWIGLALALATLARPGSTSELRIYHARHRPAAELAAVAAPLMAPEGSAVGDSAAGLVILRGPPGLLDQTETALRELDVLPRQYRVRSELVRREALEVRQLEVLGRVRVGDVWIGRLPPGAWPGEGARVALRSFRADDHELFRAEIAVLEGRVGEIWTGQVFPVSVHSHAGRGGRRVHETTTWVPVRRGLAVRPRSLAGGEVIELEAWPIVQDGHPATGVRQIGAATVVHLHPGETAVIGAIEGEGDERRVEIGAWGGLTGDSDARLLLHVERLD